MRARCRFVAAVVAVLSMAGPELARADLVRLKSGGEVRGVVDRKTSGPTSPEITVETLTGAVVVVARDHVRFISRRPLVVEEYENRARLAEPTVESQWALAEWCRTNRLSSQRETHLERVVALDPDHEEAHHALGHSLHDGEWMSRDELMTSQGYVKHKGRYITPQELELIEKSKAELDAEREWFGKVRLWSGWMNGKNEDRRLAGLANLRAISDPTAIAALTRNLSDDPDKETRALYVSVLGEMPGDVATGALVRQSLQDVDYELRYQALNAIGSDSAATARGLYLRELRSASNPIVRRAGQALERFGDQSCIPELIAALTTSHRYKMAVPEKKGTVTGSTNGQVSLGGGGGALAGNMIIPPEIQALIASGQVAPGALAQSTGPPERMRVVTIKYEHQNAEVLAALQKLSGESFGYDKRSWNLWWTSKKNGTGDAGT